ncbi:MAG: hypothetical protein U0412_09710 [Nitrospira sp.]
MRFIVISLVGESSSRAQAAVGREDHWVYRCAERVAQNGDAECCDPSGWIYARDHGSLKLIAQKV